MATRVNVIFMRGLAGNAYSRGMDACASKLAKLKNVDYITVEGYTSWRDILARIPRFKDPTVIGGHSFGANAATMIAAALGDSKKIPLLVTVDPSPYWSWSLLRSGPVAVPMSVPKVINQYQTTGLIGRQKLWRPLGTASGIENIAIESSHTEIDDLPLVHDAIIAAVKSL